MDKTIICEQCGSEIGLTYNGLMDLLQKRIFVIVQNVDMRFIGKSVLVTIKQKP